MIHSPLRNTFRRLLISISLGSAMVLLSSCGGGGGNDNNDDSGGADSLSVGNAADIRGTWVFASAGHRTGSACGLDANGGLEVRTTIIFSASTYTAKGEICDMPPGGTGTFVQDFQGSGSYKTGNVYLTAGAYPLTELDVSSRNSSGDTVKTYAGYNVTLSELRLTDDEEGNDGTTPGTRESVLGPEVFIKQ